MKCRKCESENLVMIAGSTHIGLHCKDCGAWVKWISKKELPALKIKYGEVQ